MGRMCSAFLAIAYVVTLAFGQYNLSTSVDECNELLNRATYKTHVVSKSALVLLFFDMSDASALDTVDARLGLFDALRLLCNARVPSAPYDTLVRIDRETLFYEIESLDQRQLSYRKMAYDEACLATRGLIDYLERAEPYYLEQAFMVFRRKNYIGSGILRQTKPQASPTPSANPAADVLGKPKRGNSFTVMETIQMIEHLDHEKNASCWRHSDQGDSSIELGTQ